MDHPTEGPLDTAAIREVIEEAPVTLGILYGSQARGDATPSSDIDLAVAFDESLSSVERTRARVALIERIGAVLGTDEVDVVPLIEVSSRLYQEILDDGYVLYGSLDESERHKEGGSSTHEARLEAFDEILADLERVV